MHLADIIHHQNKAAKDRCLNSDDDGGDDKGDGWLLSPPPSWLTLKYVDNQRPGPPSLPLHCQTAIVLHDIAPSYNSVDFYHQFVRSDARMARKGHTILQYYLATSTWKL